MFMSHLADLVERVLPVTSSVLEVVMSRKRPVDVPGDGAVLRGLLTDTDTKTLREAVVVFVLFLREMLIVFIPPAGLGRTHWDSF